MPATPSGKQPMSKEPSQNESGEGSSSAASCSQVNTANGGYNNGDSKASALLAAAPRLALQDEESLQPPSYDDANSIRSEFIPTKNAPQQSLGTGVEDAVEFEYAFQATRAHEELATTVVRHPGSRTTILSIQRLALGSHRRNIQSPTAFKLNAVPLAANQIELSVTANPDMAMRSLKIGMLDIAEDDPDIQCGMIDWSERGTKSSVAFSTELPDIFFEKPYSMPPDIIMFLNTFSFKPNTPRRLRATTTGASQQGFQPRFVAGPTHIIGATAAWIAIPKDSMRFDCGLFDVSSKASPTTSSFTGTVAFTKWKFPKKQPPKVFIGLVAIDADYGRPFRYSVAVTGLSNEGFSWAIRNWDDSSLAYSWSAAVSWIAIANPKN